MVARLVEEVGPCWAGEATKNQRWAVDWQNRLSVVPARF